MVIGARARHVPRERALEHVFGYTVVNDVSARDAQSGDGQWVRAKSMDSFCPLGPVVVTADEIGDPQALRLWTAVNGEVMQDASTADMIFSVAELIAYCSSNFTLEPGDLLSRAPRGAWGSSASLPSRCSPETWSRPGSTALACCATRSSTRRSERGHAGRSGSMPRMASCRLVPGCNGGSAWWSRGIALASSDGSRLRPDSLWYSPSTDQPAMRCTRSPWT